MESVTLPPHATDAVIREKVKFVHEGVLLTIKANYAD